ncbi:MAG: hypothetical protein KDI28_10175 [Pseudomonadales bacterium]|nr:hypothetical protein [Pseudomonadales bacterium]MCP5358192.1 hypothetical protein [Pseudomonadales bacterium]
MEVFLFVIAIVLIANYFSYKKEAIKLANKVDHVENSVVQKELDAVKQRLAVLEKIVTDKRYDLNEELNNLKRED